MKCLTKVDHTRVIKILLINYIAAAVCEYFFFLFLFTKKHFSFFFLPSSTAIRCRQIKISRERRRRAAKRNSFRAGKMLDKMPMMIFNPWWTGGGS